MAKGSSFERKISKQLSLWWSAGEHDDLFWRVMGSGGRATRRARTGKGVKHQSFGDIEATDVSAKGLTDLMVIELKRGYGRWAMEDVLDGATVKTQTWAKFAAQVIESWRDSGRKWWVVIYKRDQRCEMIVLCPDLFVWLTKYNLQTYDAKTDKPNPVLADVPKVFLKQAGDLSCAVMKLSDFLGIVPAVIFKEEARKCKQ